MQNLQNSPRPKLHVFVCVNDRTQRRTDMASCGPTITTETVKQVKHWIMQNGLTHQVLITKTGCLGVCPKKGGVAVIYPSQRWVTEIQDARDVVQVIKEELQKTK